MKHSRLFEAVYRPTMLFLAIVLAAAAGAGASTERLSALGGESRFLVDTDNVFVYPASAHELAHFRVELFDDWGGAVYRQGNHAAGLFLNRPTRQLDRLDGYIAVNGSHNFRRLEPQPLADLLYAYRLSDQLSVGLLGHFSYDQSDVAGAQASASNADIRVGLSYRRLEAAVGVVRRSLEDNAAEETDGDGLLLDLRLRWPVADGVELLPHLTWKSDSFALTPATRERTHTNVGIAANARPADGVLVVAGLMATTQNSKNNAPGSPKTEDTTLLLPATVLAGEVQVGSMLFRLGIRHENTWTEREEINDDATVATEKQFRTNFRTDLGLGLQFGPLTMDGLLERDFLRDGPHIIGGSRHGGGIFSRVSLTYHLE